MTKQILTDWFDPNNIKHLVAYKHLTQNGVWPKDFLPKDIQIPPFWITSIQNKMIEDWIDGKIKELETNTMDKRTLKALKGSIRKWKKVRDQKIEDWGPNNCPLCHLFYIDKYGEDYCIGCPIFEHTGEKFCEGTPHDEFIDFFENEAYCVESTQLTDSEQIKTMRELAQAEIDFLTSLLPGDNNEC